MLGKMAAFRDLSFLLCFSQCIFKDHRLNTALIDATHARTGLDCIIRCLFENKSCRSVNFHKEKDESNCEFLRNVSSEEPADFLLPDDSYDYYILLTPNRVSIYKKRFDRCSSDSNSFNCRRKV